MALPINREKEKYTLSTTASTDVRDMLQRLKDERGISKRFVVENAIRAFYFQYFDDLPVPVEVVGDDEGAT